jgi:hypothetical protein
MAELDEDIIKNSDSEEITIGSITRTRKTWREIRELLDNMQKEVKELRETMSSSSTLNMYGYGYNSRYPENFWQEHTGCIPCAFVCDCCDRMQHRCCGGATMWVYGRKSHYGEAEKMLCDTCYYGMSKPRCPCKIRPGPGPIEVDEKSGSRRVRNKCCKCYERAFPCIGCSLWISDEEREKGTETMTYYEFLDRIPRSKRRKYPAEYKDLMKWRPYVIKKPLKDSDPSIEGSESLGESESLE